MPTWNSPVNLAPYYGGSVRARWDGTYLLAWVPQSSGHRIMRSADGGATWTTVQSGVWLPSAAWDVGGADGSIQIAAGTPKFQRSADRGDTWAATTFPPGSYSTTYDNFDGLAWTGANFVSVWAGAYGASTKAATSPDGLAWTERTLPANVGWDRVVVKDGVVLALHNEYDNAVIARSTNHGVTWSATNLPTVGYQYKPAVGNGMFVMPRPGSGAANYGKYLTSEDGLTWTERTIPGAGHLYAFTYTGAEFIVNDNADATQRNFWVSADGISGWTMVTDYLPASVGTVDDIVGGGGKLLVIARQAPGDAHYAYVADAVATPPPAPPPPPPAFWTGFIATTETP